MPGGTRGVTAAGGTGQSAISQGWHFSTLQPATFASSAPCKSASRSPEIAHHATGRTAGSRVGTPQQLRVPSNPRGDHPATHLQGTPGSIPAKHG